MYSFEKKWRGFYSVRVSLLSAPREALFDANPSPKKNTYNLFCKEKNTAVTCYSLKLWFAIKINKHTSRSRRNSEWFAGLWHFKAMKILIHPSFPYCPRWIICWWSYYWFWTFITHTIARGLSKSQFESMQKVCTIIVIAMSSFIAIISLAVANCCVIHYDYITTPLSENFSRERKQRAVIFFCGLW